MDFFLISMITCKDWKEIMEEYKDSEKGFIYLDPPYLNSFHGSYDQYNTSIDENNIIIDNINIYVDTLIYLKNRKCKILITVL